MMQAEMPLADYPALIRLALADACGFTARAL